MGANTPVATREALADAFKARVASSAIYTTAASAGTKTEVTGTGYARVTPTVSDTSETDGVVVFSSVFTVPANVTVASAALLDSSGNIVDIVDAAYASQTVAGQLTVNFTFTQS